MKIAIGADHGGVHLKEEIKNHLKARGIEVEDFGTFGTQSVDYPDIAQVVARNVVEKKSDFGILICGTGIGISIAANKIKGVRAALCANEYCGRLSRQHNDANILCLGERTMGVEVAKSVTDAFLSASFDGGRHQQRVDKIRGLE